LGFYTVNSTAEDRTGQTQGDLYSTARAKKTNHKDEGLQTFTMTVCKPSPRRNANLHHDGHTVEEDTVEKDSLSGAGAPGADATDLFPGGASDQERVSPERSAPAERATPANPSAGTKGKRAAPRPKATEEQFARFWAEYPLRKGKAPAHERFVKLTPEEGERAIAGAAAYAAECRRKGTEDRYIKWAQGWLTERRFEDYASQPQASGTAAKLPPHWWRENPAAPRAIGTAGWRSLIAAHGANGRWSAEMLGPRPGEPGCVIPPDVIRELGLSKGDAR
jgi:hypothetical protein